MSLTCCLRDFRTCDTTTPLSTSIALWPSLHNVYCGEIGERGVDAPGDFWAEMGIPPYWSVMRAWRSLWLPVWSHEFVGSLWEDFEPVNLRGSLVLFPLQVAYW